MIFHCRRDTTEKYLVGQPRHRKVRLQVACSSALTSESSSLATCQPRPRVPVLQEQLRQKKRVRRLLRCPIPSSLDGPTPEPSKGEMGQLSTSLCASTRALNLVRRIWDVHRIPAEGVYVEQLHD